VGGVLAENRIVAEVIPDGAHVHPAVVRALMRAKGPEGVILVTDGIRYAGLPDGVYERPGRGRATVRGGVAVAEDGTIAGSVSPMDRNLRVLRDEVGIDPRVSLFSAAQVPASLLGLEGKGRLAAGADADFAVYDADLRCIATYVSGRRVYAAAG
jgi:N-acetylglucosamine-6-phosphate deacetylase